MLDTHDAHFVDAQADYDECMQWFKVHKPQPQQQDHTSQGRGYCFETPNAELAARALAAVTTMRNTTPQGA